MLREKNKLEISYFPHRCCVFHEKKKRAHIAMRSEISNFSFPLRFVMRDVCVDGLPRHNGNNKRNNGEV